MTTKKMLIKAIKKARPKSRFYSIIIFYKLYSTVTDFARLRG